MTAIWSAESRFRIWFEIEAHALDKLGELGGIVARRGGQKPVEQAFSWLEAMLRKATKRTVNGLWDLIGRLVDISQPAEWTNYFRSCGDKPE